MKQLLLNPFQQFSEIPLLIFGIMATAFGSWSAMQFGIRYDGVLDMHFSIIHHWNTPVIDNVIDIFCLTLFLFVAGKIVNQKTRVVDVLTTSMVARTPLYFVPFINYDGSLSVNLLDKTLNEIQAIAMNNIAMILLAGVVAFIATIWYVALLYNGYKTASNGKGSKSVLLFIGGLLVAEIISKILITYLN